MNLTINLEESVAFGASELVAVQARRMKMNLAICAIWRPAIPCALPCAGIRAKWAR